MSEAIKPTPGPWEVYTPAGDGQTYGVSADDGTAVVWFGYNSEEGIQNFDDARLIAEAGTVFHETALSPMQLVERVKELEEALTHAQRAINSMKVEAETAAQGDEQMMLEACETVSNEGLQADMAIRATLDKSLPNTVAEVK